jgi:hypothetical protein
MAFVLDICKRTQLHFNTCAAFSYLRYKDCSCLLLSFVGSYLSKPNYSHRAEELRLLSVTEETEELGAGVRVSEV